MRGRVRNRAQLGGGSGEKLDGLGARRPRGAPGRLGQRRDVMRVAGGVGGGRRRGGGSDLPPQLAEDAAGEESHQYHTGQEDGRAVENQEEHLIPCGDTLKPLGHDHDSESGP